MCKRLKDYKEEIHRCSKCGICQHSCPVYQVTGNDCTVSRGQFIMLDGVIKGDLKLNKNINKYLDLCLKCGKCQSACPTGIDVVDIILSAKHEYFKNSIEGKIYSVLESKFVFNGLLRLLEVVGRVISGKWKVESGKLLVRQTTHPTTISPWREKDLLANESELRNPREAALQESSSGCSISPWREKDLLANECELRNPREGYNPPPSPVTHVTSSPKGGRARTRVVYFGGCIEKLHPEVRDYVRTLLEKMEIELVDVKFDCCGMPFLTTGNLERFEEQTRENLKKLEGLEYDYIVTDCASCEYVISGKWKVESGKLKSIYQLIAESGLEFRAKKKQIVTYHKPCHETGMEYINTIISRCHNIEFKELEGYDECCGFAGLEHPGSLGVLSKIIKKKGENIKKVNPDCVLTSCVGCLAGMGVSTLFRKKIRRLITFLKDECEVI